MPDRPLAQHPAADNFAERFELLEESGQLDRDVRHFVEAFLDGIAAEFDVRIDEDTASQFATHVAIAFTRIRRGDDQAPPSAVVAEEIADRDRELDFVVASLRDHEDVLLREVPFDEAAYLTVHVCALIDGQKVQ